MLIRPPLLLPQPPPLHLQLHPPPSLMGPSRALQALLDLLCLQQKRRFNDANPPPNQHHPNFRSTQPLISEAPALSDFLVARIVATPTMFFANALAMVHRALPASSVATSLHTSLTIFENVLRNRMICFLLMLHPAFLPPSLLMPFPPLLLTLLLTLLLLRLDPLRLFLLSCLFPRQF